MAVNAVGTPHSAVESTAGDHAAGVDTDAQYTCENASPGSRAPSSSSSAGSSSGTSSASAQHTKVSLLGTAAEQPVPVIVLRTLK